MRGGRGSHTARCQLLAPAFPAGGRLQAPSAEPTEAGVRGPCQGLAGEAGEGGELGRVQEDGHSRHRRRVGFLVLEEGTPAPGTWVSSAEAGALF